MFGFMVILSFVLCYGYACIGIKNKRITMRMPDGQRITYDKETQARGYYVSIGLFLVLPIFILFLYFMELAK